MNTTLITNVGYGSKEMVCINSRAIYNNRYDIKYRHRYHYVSENINHVLANSIVVISNYTDTEYALPANPNPTDTVLFFIDPMITDNMVNITFDGFPKVKIYRNGSRIMGMEENLVCDAPFYSLRLTFYTPDEGWIIV